MQFYLLNPFIGRVLSVLLLDVVAFLAASVATWFYIAPPMSGSSYVASMGLGGALTFLSLYYCDVYRPAVLCSLRRSLPALIGATGIAFALATMAGFAFSTTARAIPMISHVAGFAFAGLLTGRLVFRLLSSNARLNRRVLIVGASALSSGIAHSVRVHPNLGFEIVGFLSDEADFSFSGATFAGYPILGPVHNIEKVVDKYSVDKIVVASKNRQEFFPSESLLKWKVAGMAIESGVSFLERITGKIDLAEMRPSYLIFAQGFQAGRVNEALIRTLDVAVSSVALLLASPALLLCAAAIRLESRGPIFYRQTRVGQNTEPFQIMKLRSMREDAERHTGPVFANQKDGRITRVGRVLRKSRLDEVPQLWNVLRGEMSLVGPRPERPEFVEMIANHHPHFRLRSAVKPGVTGWAQVRYSYVNEIEGFAEKLSYDLYYMKYRSVGMNLLIIWQTVKTVVLLRGL